MPITLPLALLFGSTISVAIIMIALIVIYQMKYQEHTSSKTSSPLYQFVILTTFIYVLLIGLYFLNADFQDWIGEKPYILLAPLIITFSLFILPEIKEKIVHKKHPLQKVENRVKNHFAQREHGGFEMSDWADSPFIAMKRMLRKTADDKYEEVMGFIYLPATFKPIFIKVSPFGKMEIIEYHIDIRRELIQEFLGEVAAREVEKEIELRKGRINQTQPQDKIDN